MYDTKRKNFVNKSLISFKYLVDEFEFEEPKIAFFRQENGTIIDDELMYNNKKLNKSIRISNQYHPVDYGFEINIFPFDNYNVDKGEMLFFKLKENQDIEQNYLIEMAEELKQYIRAFVVKK